MKHWICFFIGHKLHPHFNDFGYEVCQRCDHHGYYKVRFVLSYLMTRNWYKFKWWWQIHIHDRCGDCHKTKFLFGKPKGNHDDCLPF